MQHQGFIRIGHSHFEVYTSRQSYEQARARCPDKPAHWFPEGISTLTPISEVEAKFKKEGLIN